MLQSEQLIQNDTGTKAVAWFMLYVQKLFNSVKQELHDKHIADLYQWLQQ